MPKVRAGGMQKWVRRAAAATEDYTAGIQAPRRPWQEATLAAAGAHTAAVQQSLARGAFAKGVQKVSNTRWAEQATKKGAQRFAGGVSDAQQDYEAGVAPYLAVIERTVLPARGPAGDPNNIQRVAVLAAALRSAKVANTR